MGMDWYINYHFNILILYYFRRRGKGKKGKRTKQFKHLYASKSVAGVTAARGDYPFSHHKLTVQFYESSAAQDRKLEGLVHKAILELWRPDPTFPIDYEDKDKKKEKEGDKDEKTKGPSTLSKLTAEEAEHRALQAAVLQEWHILCKDRSTEVN